MKSDMTGPALGGVQERWSDYPESDLYEWIRNSQSLIDAGHPKAIEVYNEYNKQLMTAFPALTDDEVGSILLHIEEVFTAVPEVVGPVSAQGGATAEEGSSSLFFWLIFIFLAALALVLTRLLNKLRYIADVNAGLDVEAPKSLWASLTSKGVVGMIIFALVVLGGYTTVNNAIELNRMQGYAPTQPIAFSHATHAGLNQIDCQYCHDGARRSKHSVIPATNTCMNCHKAIKVGSKHGTAELTKIFASIGYNPTKDQYIENYDDLSEDEVKKIYTSWIASQYVLDNAKLDRRGERLIEDQWEGIVSSLTTPTKTKVQGPIPWVRIHNLPDHVYFSHEQHVMAGQVECQTCHGTVEEMEVMKQAAPLSMGWCVNCHRETEVKFVDNPYYESYEKYHEELQNGERDGVTVEEIGGLECQKCHY